MKEFWSELFLAFGGSSVVIAGLFTWLGKRYIDKILEAEKARNQQALEVQRNQFAVELEAEKARNQQALEVQRSQFAVELEKMKSELAKELTLFSATAEVGLGPHSLLLRSLGRLRYFCRRFRDCYLGGFSEEECDLVLQAEKEYRVCLNILRDQELILGEHVSRLTEEFLEIVWFEMCSACRAIGYKHRKEASSIPLDGRFSFIDGLNYNIAQADNEAVESVKKLNEKWRELRSLLFSQVPKVDNPKST